MTTSTHPPSPPAARRVGRPGWRDPRLVAGLVIVAVSVLLGVRLVGAADDTVPVWVAADDLTAGQPVGPGDVEARRVRFTADEDADLYLSAERPLPSGARMGRAVGHGELLPRAALALGDPASLVEVPVAVPPDLVPVTVHSGSRVDVWVAPDDSARASDAAARRVLRDVLVVAAPPPRTTLGPSGNRQIIVGVPAEQAGSLGATLAGTATGQVLLTRRE